MSGRGMPAFGLALIASLPIAGCSLDSGLAFLEGAAGGIGAAWCRHADNCYPACESEGLGQSLPDRADGPPETYCAADRPER